MTERMPWLDNYSLPKRNAKGGYEITATCGLQQFVVELDQAITAGLSEQQSQVMLRELRLRIEKAAQLGRDEGEAHPESQKPGVLLFASPCLPRILMASSEVSPWQWAARKRNPALTVSRAGHA